MSLTWHETNGGPFLLIPRSALPQWLASPAEYDRACAVDDYAGTIDLPGGTRALVLGDEPLATAYLPEHRLLARWCHADGDDGVIDMITGALPEASWKKGPELRIPGPLVMFDAACHGHEVGTLTDGLVLDLPPSGYCVDTAWIEPSPRARFLVHRFREHA